MAVPVMLKSVFVYMLNVFYYSEPYWLWADIE
ncbi:hypothetical protein SAMN05444285_10619 [Draconibacterium orientale]|jgi:hypothetical protein|uniref:Uncharacterized protein n=1 Tax=Draconibacterium orientale TaxID=1168034 RepID=A0A1I0BSH3_9BACT|nr:hypothetical protein SAMN05444285_10619 [Draconibacterium orientale]